MVLNSTQRSGGGSSNLFCLLDDEIPSGIGRKFSLQNGACVCVQTVLLSASYDNIILKAKQVICLESLYLKKAFSRYVEKYTPLQLSRAALPVY